MLRAVFRILPPIGACSVLYSTALALAQVAVAHVAVAQVAVAHLAIAKVAVAHDNRMAASEVPHLSALLTSNLFLSSSHAAIFAGLAWAMSRLQRVPQLVAYRREFKLFSAFLILCAVTRISEVISLWWRIDQLSLTLKTLCAIVSVPVAALLLWKLPGIVKSVCETTHLLARARQDVTNRIAERTALKDATEELAQQHELLRVTMQSIGDGVITTDAESNVLWLNPVAERMTGWATLEAAGRPLTEIFHILNYVSRLPVDNPIVACLESGEAGKLAPDTILISRDGSRYGIDDSAAPIRGASGELLGAVLVFHDVTEQRRLFFETSRVARAEIKLKDDFLSRVSHELRSPLTSIYSFTSIIADELAGETTPQQQDFLQIVLKNVNQLQAMIEDLLTVTQANEGKLSIEPRQTNASDAVRDAVNTIQGAASRKHIGLSSSLAEHLPDAYADPTRVLQVLIILLDNAVKFTPIGGKVHVRVSEGDRGFILVEVADTGCGIPPDKRMHVFENLYQITGPDQPDTSHAGRNGLGLGLHIARELVTRQGGRIWVTGASLRGSVFSFTLPVFRSDLNELEINDDSLIETVQVG